MTTLQKISPPSVPKPLPTDSDMIPVHHSVSHDEPELRRPTKNLSRSGLLLMMAIVGTGFGTLFYAGWTPRQHLSAQLHAESHRIQTALPSVRVIKPRQSPPVSAVTLPGDVQAMEEITIYPRASGYIKRWLVDIGDEVQEGQLLAEIDIPEVKAQLEQTKAALGESRASLERARATVNLAAITTNRLRPLVAKKTVAQQELDDAENSLAVAEATVRLGEATIEANVANVHHIEELLSFSVINSPFAGTVTARHVDTGKLVTSGNGTGQALFQIARTNPVRVFINVPQIYAPGVMKDLQAQITSREQPGRVFEGSVTRTARAIDPITRTLLTEVQVPNDDHALLTGSYVQVKMDVERVNPPLLIPASSLVFNASGTRVAIVNTQGKVEFRSIEVAGDFGSEIGVTNGLSSDDQVVINPGDRLSDGVEVQVETHPMTTPSHK